ncbi:MAG: phosphoenolpyruvate carboxykinase (ATP), partial [Planctomycetota bacterium]
MACGGLDYSSLSLYGGEVSPSSFGWMGSRVTVNIKTEINQAGRSMAEQGHGLQFDPEYTNLRPSRLYEIGASLEGAKISSTGALAANSGVKTGRSPKDKRVVRNAASEGDVW